MNPDKELEREEEALRSLFDATAATPSPDRLDHMLARATRIPAGTARQTGWRRWLEPGAWLRLAGPALAGAVALAVFVLEPALHPVPEEATPRAGISSLVGDAPEQSAAPFSPLLTAARPTDAGLADGGDKAEDELEEETVALEIVDPFAGLDWGGEGGSELFPSLEPVHTAYSGGTSEDWLAVYGALLNL